MTRRHVLTAAVFALLTTIAASYASARMPAMADVWNGAQINWRDIRSGIYESAKTGRPVIMVFHASWCGYCKKYRAVFKDPGVVEASKDFVMILVDADADRSTNGAFSPDGTYVPRTLFLDSDGTVLAQYHGKTDPEHPHTIDIAGPRELRELMERARTDFQQKPGAAPAPAAAGEDKT